MFSKKLGEQLYELNLLNYLKNLIANFRQIFIWF